jgi:hypothetical protein
VVIESATRGVGANGYGFITATVSNEGGDGAYFFEVASVTTAVVRSQFVGVKTGYRETVTFDIASGNIATFGEIAAVRVYSSVPDNPISTRTSCHAFVAGNFC